MNTSYNCPPMCSRCNRLHYTNQPCKTMIKSDSAIPGMLCLVILAICVGMLTCCAEYPVAIAVRGDYGEINYSRARGFEIIVEK